MEQLPSPQPDASHLSMGTHAHIHTDTHFQFCIIFLKGKKPTVSIAFEVTLPEEFCTEVIYCLAQLKFKKKSEPTILVSFQDLPPPP